MHGVRREKLRKETTFKIWSLTFILLVLYIGEYYSKAMKPNSTAALSGSARINSRDAQESAPRDDGSDVWVVEMQYRVLVAYQNTAWDKGSMELAKLFQRMKEEECTRRTHLREYLVAFVQRQQRLFLSLPGTYNPMLEELVGREMSRTEIEEMVQSAIHSRAQKFQKADLKTSKPGLNPAEITEDEEDFTLDSPLTSELLTTAQVVEKRVVGVLKAWKTALAVVTADSFLHLFEVPSGRVQAGDTPEVAFKTLLPEVVVPSAENLSYGKSNFAKGWSDSLAPTESFILANSTLQVREDNSLEVTETVETKGATKMFAKTVKRSIILKTLNKKDTEDLIVALKG